MQGLQGFSVASHPKSPIHTRFRRVQQQSYIPLMVWIQTRTQRHMSSEEYMQSWNNSLDLGREICICILAPDIYL